jgi:hypothetical protein
MTIIISAANHSYAFQFSDRRLSANRKVLEEHSNKATVFTCLNGRFAVGFTGLAKIPGFAFQPWLVEALYRSAPPDYGTMETAERLKFELDLLFDKHPGIARLHSFQKRLTLLFSGYIYIGGRPFILNLWISNFQNFETFEDFPLAQPRFHIFSELEAEEHSPPVSFIQRVGMWTAMTRDDEDILRRVLESSGSLETLVNAGVSVVRRVSNRPLSQNSVGEEVAVAIVPRDPREPATSRVRLSKSSNAINLLDSVLALPPAGGVPSMMIRDVKLEVQNRGGKGQPAIRAIQGPNELCSCKSGLKFKYCHGRLIQRPSR